MTQVISNVDAKVAKCEKIINYIFATKALILEALNAAGGARITVYYNATPYNLARNDAIAVLGDAYMAAYLCRLWFGRSPAARNKAQWTAIREDQLSNDKLDERMRNLGLDDCIIVNPGAEVMPNGSRVTKSMAATGLEAIMGAVYLDGGELEMERVMRHLGLHDHLYLKEVFNDRSWIESGRGKCERKL